MITKGSNVDWRQSVRSATSQPASPPAPKEAPKAEPPALAPAPLPEVHKVPLGTYIPETMLFDLKELALRLSKEYRRRVTMSDVVTEALGEYIEKHAT